MKCELSENLDDFMTQFKDIRRRMGTGANALSNAMGVARLRGIFFDDPEKRTTEKHACKNESIQAIVARHRALPIAEQTISNLIDPLTTLASEMRRAKERNATNKKEKVAVSATDLICSFCKKKDTWLRHASRSIRT